MQRYILAQRKQITWLGAILIVAGFIGKLWLKNETAAAVFLIAASLLGVMPIAIQAYQAVRVKVISIELLVTFAVAGAFIIKNFEESAIVTFLFLFGSILEQRTINKTRSAIKELTAMAPQRALKLMPDDSFVEVAVDEVKIGDTLLVRTGDQIPVDGIVLSGEGAVNEASLTGESLPVAKETGGFVFAGTILDNGTIRITAQRVGEDTTFGQIIELVEEAQDSKSAAERFIDRFAKYYTPVVLLIGLAVWALTKDLELAVTILVLGCPGALVIGVPVANVAGIGNGARNGVLLKGSEVIGDFSRLDTLVFDKTGTLTVGNPTVAERIYYGTQIETALSCLASVETESDHPLARAVLNDLADVPIEPVSETKVVKGLGITAEVGGHKVAVGNIALMELEHIPLNSQVKKDIDRLAKEGHSLVLTAVDGAIKILLGIKDSIRPGVIDHLKKLRQLGARRMIMLSGDNQQTAELVGSQLGLDEVHGQMLPADKAAFIAELMQEKGQTVAFVGDGVNDSPSLALANVGIAMGGGTDVAIETSDIVLINSDFGRLPHALGLARATARNMRQNILIAVGVVLLLLSGVLFSDWMNMTIGMFVHEGSILVVILNGMRLLRYRLK